MARNNEMAYNTPPPIFPAFSYYDLFPPPPPTPQIDIFIILCGQDISLITHETLK